MDTLKIFETAVEMMNECGHDAEVYENYSGRSMYGKTTTGIVSDAAGPVISYFIITAALEIYEDELENYQIMDEVFEIIPKRYDSMGLSTIYY
jgi:hypothetical protein